MKNISIDVSNATIAEIAELIDEITKGIIDSQGKALENSELKEKWYKRITRKFTFYKDNQKVILKDIYDTNILLQIVAILSKKIYEENHAAAIKFADCLIEHKQKISLLENTTQKIIDQLNALVYVQHSNYDVSVLPKNEKIILNSALNSIFVKISHISGKTQQMIDFHSAIRIYLGNDCETEDLIIDADRELSNVSKPKIFYYCLLVAISYFDAELKTESLNCFSELLQELELGDQSKREIKENILKTISALGQEHFINRYKKEEYIFDEFLDDEFFEFDSEDAYDEILETENYEESVVDDIDTKINTDEFVYFSEPITDVNELEEQTLSGIMHIKEGEEKVFRGFNLHLQNTINCDGNLIFDSCVINFNETIAHPSINISAAGQLTFVNCYIRNYDRAEQFFINVAKCDNEENIIRFENCRFHNCSKFIDCGKRNVKLVKCNITHQPINFICNANYCDISESSIDIKTKETEDYEVYYIISSENASLTNCKVISNNKEYTSALGGRLYLFRNLNLIENCLIDNTANLTRYCSERATVVNSAFEKCTNIILGGVIDNCKISDCKQVNCHSYKSICKDSLIINCENLEFSTLVENCEINGCDCSSVFFTIANKSWFINCTKISLAGANDCVFEKCTNCISCHGTVDNSFFHMCYDEIIFACRSIKNSIFLNCFARSRNFIEINPNENVVIDNVFFYDCSVKNAFYFSNLTLEQKAKTSPIVISNCKFLNCKTDNPNKEIIKQNKLIHKVKLNKVYDSTKKHLFERKPKYNDVDVIKVTNCMGLDKINQIDNNIVLPEIPKLPDREYITGYSVEIAEIFHEMDSNNLYPFCIK